MSARFHRTDDSYCSRCRRDTLGPMCLFCDGKTIARAPISDEERARRRERSYGILTRGGVDHELATTLVNEVVVPGADVGDVGEERLAA